MSKYRNICCLGFFILLAACRKDASKPAYQAINEVQISGLEISYSVLQGQRLKITPQLDFTIDDGKDPSRYEYEWMAADIQQIIISHQRNLDTTINLAPQQYIMYYRVRDKISGVQWAKKFDLYVQTSIYQGWMVLCDVNGTARLDMVSQQDTGYMTIHDVLKFAGSSLTLQGAPVDLACFPYTFSQYGIYITTTGTGTTKVDPESFQWAPEMELSYETLMKDIPDNFGADFMVAKGSMLNSYLYKGGNVYYYSGSAGLRYSVPVNIVQGEPKEFVAAPFITSSPADFADYAPSVMYDITGRRFLQHAPGRTYVTPVPAGTLFDFNNTGKDLIFMTSSKYNGSFSGGEVFVVMKDPATAKYYLGRFTIDAFGPSFVQTYWQEMTATDIGLAENFAVNPDFGYVFYNVGGKLYEYDMFSKQSTLMLDKGAGKITLLKFQRFLQQFAPATSQFFNKLIVASYDNTTANGDMEIYAVPDVNGALQLLSHYSGFGKIKNIEYRER